MEKLGAVTEHFVQIVNFYPTVYTWTKMKSLAESLHKRSSKNTPSSRIAFGRSYYQVII
jgi:hypothetical protein